MSLPERQNVSVLIVDDDPDLLDSLRAMLEAYEYQVTCVADAATAIREVERIAPDVVITDIYMPGSDGFALIDALRSGAAAMPIVAMSGGSRGGTGYDNLAVATQLGAAAVIDKPFTHTCLMETIERVLTRPRSSL